MKTIAIPVSVFDVTCEIASGRPFATAERTILRAIAAGNVEFENLVQELHLHPRMTTECLTVLFEAGIIEFADTSGAFSITPIGKTALADASFLPPTLKCISRPFKVIVERITGLAAIGRDVMFERTDEMLRRGVVSVAPSDLDPTPGRSVIRQLVERTLRPGEWVRSVGRPDSVYRYSNSVPVDIRDGRLEGLRSIEWAHALASALRERGFELADPVPYEPPSQWYELESSMVRTIWGAEAHLLELSNALDRAEKYVFLHSAFLAGTRVRHLSGQIAAALRRGVDVLLARGGTTEEFEADKDGCDVFNKLAYDERAASGRFFFEPFPTGSHAKVLIRDGQEACVGSYNWLSASLTSRNRELSVVVRQPDVAAAVCDVAADLFVDGGASWPSQLLRTKVTSAGNAVGGEGVSVRLVLDNENRDCLFQYLDAAQEGLMILSDRVTPKPDAYLHNRLVDSARRLAHRSALRIKFARVDGDTAPILEGVEAAGGSVECVTNNHAKALFADDNRALITSFNLLSFGGHSTRRSSAYEIGIELRTTENGRSFGGLFQENCSGA